MRLYIWLLWCFLACTQPVVSSPIDDAKAKHSMLVKAIAEEKAKLPQDSKRVNDLQAEFAKIVGERETLVTRVEAQLMPLYKRLYEKRITLKLNLDIAENLADQWQDSLNGRILLSTTERRKLRNDLASARERIGKLRAEIPPIEVQIRERNEALKAASLDVRYTEKVTSLSADIFRNQTLLNLRRNKIEGLSEELKEALLAFKAAISVAPPLVVDTVSVSEGNTDVFKAFWANAPALSEPEDQLCGPPPLASAPTSSSNNNSTIAAEARIQRHMVELQVYISLADQITPNLTSTIEELNKRAASYVERQVELNNEYAAIYKEIGELENNILIMNTAVDVSVVLIEVALTGGYATVTRKGIELAAEQAGKLAAQKMSKKFGRAIAKELVGETREVAQRKFVELYAQRMSQRAINKVGMPAIKKRAVDVFGETADEIVNAAIEARTKNLFKAARAAYLRKYVMAGGSKILPSGQSPEGRAAGVVLADVAEFGFDRAVKSAAYLGSDQLAKSGRNMPKLSKLMNRVKPDKLSELVPKTPADIAGFIGTGVKAAFAAHEANEINQKAAKAAQVMAEYQVLTTTYDWLFLNRLSLQEFKTSLTEIKELSLQQITAMQNGKNVHRQLVLSTDEPIENIDGNYMLKIKFSRPLTTPPSVQLGDVPFEFEPTTNSATGQAEWEATIPMEEISKLSGRQILSISARDPNGRTLDSSPTSLAFPKLSEPGYHFYTTGEDKCYLVNVDVSWPVKLSAEGLNSSYKIKAKEDE